MCHPPSEKRDSHRVVEDIEHGLLLAAIDAGSADCHPNGEPDPHGSEYGIACRKKRAAIAQFVAGDVDGGVSITQDDEGPGKPDGDDIVGVRDIKKNAADMEEHRQFELVGETVLDDEAFGRLAAVFAIIRFRDAAGTDHFCAPKPKKRVKTIDQGHMGKEWPEDLIAGHVWPFPFRFRFRREH